MRQLPMMDERHGGGEPPVFERVAVVGCGLILGIKDKPIDDGNVDAGPLPSDPCQHYVPPEPPVQDDDPDGINRFVLAARKVNLGGGDAGVLGFDLDDSCTCFGGPGARHDAAPSCNAATNAANPGASSGTCQCDNTCDGFTPRALNHWIAWSDSGTAAVSNTTCSPTTSPSTARGDPEARTLPACSTCSRSDKRCASSM